MPRGKGNWNLWTHETSGERPEERYLAFERPDSFARTTRKP